MFFSFLQAFTLALASPSTYRPNLEKIDLRIQTIIVVLKTLSMLKSDFCWIVYSGKITNKKKLLKVLH